MTGWRLKPAGKAEADALIAIEARAFGAASWGRQGVADGLADHLTRAIVALDAETKPQGFVMWRRIGDEAEILTIAVAPDRQRQGCASALLKAVFDALHGEGARSLFLEVDAGNTAAIALYEALGFVRIARRKRYYRSGAEALVMRADL